MTILLLLLSIIGLWLLAYKAYETKKAWPNKAEEYPKFLIPLLMLLSSFAIYNLFDLLTQ